MSVSDTQRGIGSCINNDSLIGHVHRAVHPPRTRREVCQRSNQWIKKSYSFLSPSRLPNGSAMKGQILGIFNNPKITIHTSCGNPIRF